MSRFEEKRPEPPLISCLHASFSATKPLTKHSWNNVQHTFVWTLWRWNPILFCSLINTTKPTAFHISSFMAIMSQRKAYIVSCILLLLQFSFSSVLSPQWIKISKYKYVWMVSGHSHNRSKRQALKSQKAKLSPSYIFRLQNKSHTDNYFVGALWILVLSNAMHQNMKKWTVELRRYAPTRV